MVSQYGCLLGRLQHGLGLVPVEAKQLDLLLNIQRMRRGRGAMHRPSVEILEIRKDLNQVLADQLMAPIVAESHCDLAEVRRGGRGTHGKQVVPIVLAAVLEDEEMAITVAHRNAVERVLQVIAVYPRALRQALKEGFEIMEASLQWTEVLADCVTIEDRSERQVRLLGNENSGLLITEANGGILLHITPTARYSNL